MSANDPQASSRPFRVGEWLCEPRLFRMTGREGAVQVEPKVMQVLICLAARPGRVVTRQELLDSVWAETTVTEQVLSRAISELRKLFGDDSRSPRFIETIAKSGYRLIAPVGKVEERELQEAQAPVPVSLQADGMAPAPPEAARPAVGHLWILIAGIALGALATGLVWLAARSQAPAGGGTAGTRDATHATVLLPPEMPPELGGNRAFDLSPDGRVLAYGANLSGQRQLVLRRLDRDEVEPLAGTQGGFGPFFSADSRQLGFYVDGKLKRVPVEGGESVTLHADASDAMGATWGADGTIVFTRRMLEGLWWIPPAEGARPLTELRPELGERSHFWPELLPDGEHLLFTVWRGGGINECDIEILHLESGERRTLITGGADARYLPDGILLYARAGRLMRVSFSLTDLAITGTPSPVLEDLATHPILGVGHYAVAEDGTLIYAAREAVSASRSLFWIDAGGRYEPLELDRRPYATPQLSPDGSKLAATVGDFLMEVWLFDLERGASERLAGQDQRVWPLWTPDGSRIVFSSETEGGFNLFWQGARSDDQAERLTRSDNLQFPGSFSSDGRWLAYSEFDPETRWDIFLLPLGGERQPVAFLESPFDEFRPTFSPDGRFLAYVSNEAGRWDASGRWEVYVRPLEEPEARIQISTGGGGDPHWALDGQRLFFRQEDRLMAVGFEGATMPRAGQPELVLGGLQLPESVDMLPTFDIGPDGRFLVVRLDQPGRPVALNLRLGALEPDS